MNRRDFVRKTIVGGLGLTLLPPQALGSIETPKKFVKHFPEKTWIWVNETTKPLELPSKMTFNDDWQLLGYTEGISVFENDRMDVLVEKLDVKITGVAIKPDNVRQVVLVLHNKLSDNQIQFYSMDTELIETPTWFSRAYTEDYVGHHKPYRLIFKPFKTAVSKTKRIFEMTFFSGIR